MGGDDARGQYAFLERQLAGLDFFAETTVERLLTRTGTGPIRMSLTCRHRPAPLRHRGRGRGRFAGRFDVVHGVGMSSSTAQSAGWTLGFRALSAHESSGSLRVKVSTEDPLPL